MNNNNYDNNQSHLYYNITIAQGTDSNGIRTSIQNPTPGNYAEQRKMPILNNPSEWMMSVLRFSCPGDSLPINIMPIKSWPNTDVNLTNMVLGLKYSTFSASAILIWLPQSNIPPPQPPTFENPLRPLIEYYYLKNYQTLVDMVNNAFKEAFDALKLLVPLPTDIPPYMIYTPENKRFSIITDQTYITNNNGDTAGIKIYFGYDLYAWFFSFPAIILRDQAIPYDNQILIENKGYNLIDQTGSNVEYYNIYSNVPAKINDIVVQTEQNFDSSWRINTVKKIVFLTSLLPVAVKEITSPKITAVAGALTYSTISQTANNFKSILTDYDLTSAIEDKGISRQAYQYIAPSPAHRLIDLCGSDGLYSIDIQVFWADDFNNLYPLMLTRHSIVDIKLQFIRKNFQAIS